MKIAFGCDHAGYVFRARLFRVLDESGHDLIDCGTDSAEPVDYPQFAKAVGEKVLSRKAARGILVCGSGVGASIAANKLHGIRAGLCHDTYTALQAVSHDNINILCLGARVIGPELAAELVHVFLHAEFSGKERHIRRLKMIAEMEEGDGDVLSNA